MLSTNNINRQSMGGFRGFSADVLACDWSIVGQDAHSLPTSPHVALTDSKSLDGQARDVPERKLHALHKSCIIVPLHGKQIYPCSSQKINARTTTSVAIRTSKLCRVSLRKRPSGPLDTVSSSSSICITSQQPSRHGVSLSPLRASELGQYTLPNNSSPTITQRMTKTQANAISHIVRVVLANNRPL